MKQAYNRRQFLKLGATATLICAGAGLGPWLARNRQVYKQSRYLMGTMAEIQVVHADPNAAHEAMEHAYATAMQLEDRLSHFRVHSDIGRANTSAFEAPVSVSQDTHDVLKSGLHWAKVTQGLYDPAIGRLTQIWKEQTAMQHHQTANLPAPETYLELANQNLYQHLELSEQAGQPMIRFKKPEVQLDLGGVGKGYALDRMMYILRLQGIEQALVNLGGEVGVLGTNRHGEEWKVGIRDPHRPSAIAKVLRLSNQVVATSGNYEQYFYSQADKKLYHHLIHPHQAKPVRQQFHSLSVVAKLGTDADALSTGLFFLSEAQTSQVLNHHTENVQVIRLG